ncbi:MAG: DNA polymerase III subunit delta' C-terminal domain-containing protein, partial [Agromyces sp.]
DLASLYRDVLLIQLDADVPLVNRELEAGMQRAAASASPARTLATLDAIQQARTRIDGNVSPALALEAMLVSAIRRTTERGAA